MSSWLIIIIISYKPPIQNCVKHNTHITHVQHATVLFVVTMRVWDHAILRIIAMSWPPQKITISSSKRVDSTNMSNSANWKNCSLHFPGAREKSLIVSGLVTRSVQGAGRRWSVHHIIIVRPPGAPVLTIDGHALFNTTASHFTAIHRSY